MAPLVHFSSKILKFFQETNRLACLSPKFFKIQFPRAPSAWSSVGSLFYLVKLTWDAKKWHVVWLDPRTKAANQTLKLQSAVKQMPFSGFSSYILAAGYLTQLRSKSAFLEWIPSRSIFSQSVGPLSNDSPSQLCSHHTPTEERLD